MLAKKNEGTDPKHRNVKVIYGRRGVSGYAWYNSNSVVIKLLKNGSEQVNIHRVAQVYIHEVGHNLNLRHADMVKSWDIDVGFLEEGKVEVKTQKPKTSAADKNEEKARKKLAEWEKKMSRAKNLVKKYQKKIKYYDKKKEKVIV